ncbi:MAG: aminotransferase class III-fold pyridoxal phosphate-dependent enzyme [Bacteroidota bacterium]
MQTNYSDIEITTLQAEALALRYYGLKVSAKKLPGFVDFNFYIKTKNNEAYTLKVTRPASDPETIAYQTALLQHLEKTNTPLDLPTTILAKNGEASVPLGNNRFLRILKWVPGRILKSINPRSAELLESWGKTAALLSAHLNGFDHPAAHRFENWNPSETLYAKKYRAYIKEQEQLEIADYFWNLFETAALPFLPDLRKSVNHDDAHEQNLLVSQHLNNPEITGIIDFGDAIYTETINELAIACAYSAMGLPDPLSAISHVVGGYHKTFPIEEKELKVLFPLIGARLMITVANAAWNRHREPENEYLFVSEKPAWDLLKKLRSIPPELAYYTFRDTCGMEACPQKELFKKLISDVNLHPVVDFQNKQVTTLDLSVGSLDLGNNNNFATINKFEKTINSILEENNAEFGIGGYGEVRPFYTTDAYKVEGNNGAQWRTVHLGIDVWAAAGTPVCAPLAGKIFGVFDNAGDCNYGPTIILEHTLNANGVTVSNGNTATGESLIFYSLYGHLSTESLAGKENGMLIEKGEKIAEFGAPPINGNWPPHLHFQIMLNMLGNKVDFPGVAYPEEINVWKSICPDPSLFFSKKIKTKKYAPASEIISARKNKLGKSLSISYERPLHIVRGYMQYLYDSTGRRFLDTVNNVAHVGHEHPKVVRAAQRQIGLLNTNTRYLHENIIRFSEELLATFPPELSVVHLVNSGSEANELAMRMVEAYTGSKEMIAVEVGYHGNTGRSVDVSSYKFDGKGGKGAPPKTHVVPIPDTFRGIYKNEKNAGEKYASHILEKINKLKSGGKNVGGFICESILSCGGQIVLPKNYLKNAYQFVRENGGLCIADEVQVGFGRVGEKFWGFELQEVVPDIVTLGKPIGNGHPLAAVVTTRKVADAFANGMEYFNTFGGNPVSCAIGSEVLKIVKENNWQKHALEAGNYLKNKLIELKNKFPVIGDVRGHGLFLGFELIKNIETLEPAAGQASYLANRMRERGILMSTDGPFHNVIKIKPPMCFNKQNADFLISNLEIVLAENYMAIN